MRILLTGFLKAQWAVDMVRMKQGKWYLAAISALLSLVFAWIILSTPFASTAALWMFVAISLIVEAFVDVFVLLFRKKVLEQGDSSVVSQLQPEHQMDKTLLCRKGIKNRK